MSFHRLLPAPRDSGRARRCAHPPSTPPLHWKFFFDSPRNNGGTKAASARKFAAGLWHLQLAAAGVPAGSGKAVGIEPSMKLAHCASRATIIHGEHSKNEGLLATNVSSYSKHGVLHNKVKSSRKVLTKGDVTRYDEVHCSYTRVKIIDQQHDEIEPVRIPSASRMQSKLAQAQFRIFELEYERRGSRKKVSSVLRELEEERRVWRAREEGKLRAVFVGMKDVLVRERSRKKMEAMNARLVDELRDVRSCAERLGKLYENEKKYREVIEVVCDELATIVGEQNEELEELRRDSVRFEVEIEEERRMMHMADQWREERVQMKLNDAKFMLESKCSEMVDLISQLDALLVSKSTNSFINAIEPRRPKEIKEVTKGMKSNVNDGDECHASHDLYTVLEEIERVGDSVSIIESCNDGNVALANRLCSSHNEKSSKDSSCFLKESKNMSVCVDRVKRMVQKVPLTQSEDPVDNGLGDQGCVGEWRLNELLNPHITRGMKGRVEWPRGLRKCSPSKAKGSQARMERQRAKLRSVVKHRLRH